LQRTIAAALYWLAAVTIALGAYGHGFVGVVPLRVAIEALPLDSQGVLVISSTLVSRAPNKRCAALASATPPSKSRWS